MPLEREQLQRLYREAREALPERDRRLIQLRFVEDKDYDAITAELELSPGAARKAVHTAIARLRERLRQLAPELFRGGRSP